MKQYIIVLFVIQIFLFSCSKEVSIRTEYIKPDTIFSQLSDSSYFINIKSINYENGNVYLADYERSQIFILNKDYSLVKCIGSKGKGPGELQDLSKLFISDDTIYAYNGGKVSIDIFGQTSHLKTIKIPNSIRTSSATKFLKSYNNLYFSSVNPNGTSIALYDMISNEIKLFGKIVNYNTPKETIIKNEKHILNYKNYIIAVPDNRYAIEIYDNKTNFIKEIKYDNINNLLRTNNNINSKPIDANSYYVLIPDVYLFGDYLYLMLLTYDTKIRRMQSNSILEINLNDNFSASRLLDLGEGWFETICVFDNTLLTFDSMNGNVISYNLK